MYIANHSGNRFISKLSFSENVGNLLSNEPTQVNGRPKRRHRHELQILLKNQKMKSIALSIYRLHDIIKIRSNDHWRIIH